MSEAAPSYFYLPGAGGGRERDLAGLAPQLNFRLQTILYPGWQRYVKGDFSAEALVAELTAEMIARVPSGPIGIIGISLGGHLGYSISLRLLAMGREVHLLCAIDSFMFSSASAATGWQGRAISDATDMIRRRDFAALARFTWSRFWRIVMRLLGDKLPVVLRRFADSGKLPFFVRADPLAEQELNMRLLLGELAPWVSTLDRDLVELRAPAILLRTADSAKHDPAWKRRCPEIVIREIAGRHETLLEPETMRGIEQAFASAMSELAAPSGLE